MNVYIVDDERDVARTLARSVERLGHSAACFLSGEAFLSVVEDLTPGCVLLDLMLPARSGLEIQAELAERRHCHAVALISGWGEVPDAVQAMRAGAIDFLRKPYRQAELGETLARAEEFVEACKRRRIEASRFDRLGLLSAREREILAALGGGLSTKQVAFDLGISARTVDMHRGNILRKLDMTSIAAALLFARDAAFTGAMPR